MGYIRIQTFRPVLLAALILSLYHLSHAATDTGSLPFATANELMAAVGKQKLATAQLESTLDYCAVKFPHLQESARNAQLSWQKGNQAILSLTALVNTAVIESVRLHASPFVAEKMALEIDNVVRDSVKQLTAEFAAKSRKEQHYLCNRLILSTAAGERDLQIQNPQETQRLLTFKQ